VQQLSSSEVRSLPNIRSPVLTQHPKSGPYPTIPCLRASTASRRGEPSREQRHPWPARHRDPALGLGIDQLVIELDTNAGHAGGRSLTKVIDDTTMEMAFLAGELGTTVP